MFQGNLLKDERVLITGASGGLGIAAIQYAGTIGAEIVALVSSEEKEQVARRSGAHHILRLDQMTSPRDDMRDALGGAGVRLIRATSTTGVGRAIAGDGRKCTRPRPAMSHPCRAD